MRETLFFLPFVQAIFIGVCISQEMYGSAASLFSFMIMVLLREIGDKI